MAFELKAKESVSDGIRRNARHQLEKALDHLGTKKKPHRRGALEHEDDAREVRKCFKKMRGALRLVREDLGEEVYHEENFCFRDAGRLLREIRDAKVLVETVERLSQQAKAAVDAGVFAKIHEALRANQREVTRRVVDKDGAFAAVEEAIRHALARLPDWRIERDGWAVLERGLRVTYRRGHRALALAAETPSVLNLHEWRKQTRHLRSQLQFLEVVWSGREKALGDQTQELLQLLGDDHDLAVLRETLAADPLVFGGHGALKGVIAVIDRQREELERRAFTLGRKLYKDPSKIFTSRIAAHWKTWAPGSEAAKPSARTRSAPGRKVVSTAPGRRRETPDAGRDGGRSAKKPAA
jgi:CHAD domain-containing protein